MPGVNGYNVGRDVTVQVVDGATGQVVALNGKTASDFRPIYVERNSHGLDGINRFLPIPSGWQGTIEIDRKDNSLDSYIAFQEAGYYAGAGIAGSTITETIQNADGSVSVFLFLDVMFNLTDDGNWAGDNKTTLRLAWRGSQRVQLQ